MRRQHVFHYFEIGPKSIALGIHENSFEFQITSILEQASLRAFSRLNLYRNNKIQEQKSNWDSNNTPKKPATGMNKHRKLGVGKLKIPGNVKGKISSLKLISSELSIVGKQIEK